MFKIFILGLIRLCNHFVAIINSSNRVSYRVIVYLQFGTKSGSSVGLVLRNVLRAAEESAVEKVMRAKIAVVEGEGDVSCCFW